MNSGDSKISHSSSRKLKLGRMTMALAAILSSSSTSAVTAFQRYSPLAARSISAFATNSFPSSSSPTFCRHEGPRVSSSPSPSLLVQQVGMAWNRPPLSKSYSSTTSVLASSVEEDLDAALDDILGAAFAEAEDGEDDEEGEEHHFIPENLVEEEDPINYHDPKFLSTSNPHWTKAGLSQSVIDVLSEKGITTFTPVQGEAFAPVVAGRDVIGRSRTGTGKTLAFSLPSITRLTAPDENGEVKRRPRGRKPSMVVLCPTRELARQVQEEILQVSRPLGLYSTVFHGGVSYGPQASALRQGLDILVGTPGRIIDHLDRGNTDLSEVDIVVLDEADEMLNMGFAEDVETILEGVGSANEKKTQFLLFSATTPPWVKEIGDQYQEDVISIDATSEEAGARTATTVRHMAIQVPPGQDSAKSILEDIIAVEISKDIDPHALGKKKKEEEELAELNPIAAAAAAEKRKKNANSAMQQKIFGKTIVFTETKRDADELVSGGVFKSLTAQALHGDVGQKQRDATLAAFRAGAFNVLVATDVAARGIDINDVDLVVQFEPPRDTDTYVHRSGRTGRAGRKGTSVLLFRPNQSRDIVRIERSLGHGFKFELAGPPSIESALSAAAKTSAIACRGIPDETAKYFQDAASSLLENGEDPQEVVARCLAAISRRSSEVESRSLLTGELGLVTVEMTNSRGRPVSPGDVMFTVSKLSKMSQRGDGDLNFDSDVGKIHADFETGSAIFDMGVEDAKRLVEFSKDIEAGGASFSILRERNIERGRNFGMDRRNNRGGGRYGRGGGGGGYNRGGGGGYRGRNNNNGGYRGGGGGGGGYRRAGNNFHGGSSRSNYESRHGGGGYRDRYNDRGGGRRYEGGGGNDGRRYRGGGGGDSGGW